jgi:hypothetical protein
MWQNLTNLLRWVFDFGQKTQKNSQDIEELQREVKRLTDAVQCLAFELQRQRENEAHEREKMLLRLENELLKFERRLPSSKNAKD